jgi:hypothetical protein
VGVAVNVTEVPEQMVDELADTATEGVNKGLTVKFVPLSEPVVTGLLATTLILYPVPNVVPAGNTAEMVPLVVLVKVPMLTGDVKLPVASESCAVNTFPALNVPDMV